MAKQGYVDLTAGRLTHAGDSAEMVAAREELLGTGLLDFIGDEVVRAVLPYPDGMVVEVGAGTGRHLARLLDARPGLVGLAVDVSKPALRRAARAHPRMSAVRADIWRGLPVVAGAATLVLDVFAPRSGAEFARILAPHGALVVVTPAPGHLAELVEPLGLVGIDPAKEQRLAGSLDDFLVRVDEALHIRQLRLSRAQAQAIIAMGPSAHHVDASDRAASLAETSCVTAATKLSVWRPRGNSRAAG